MAKRKAKPMKTSKKTKAAKRAVSKNRRTPKALKGARKGSRKATPKAPKRVQPRIARRPVPTPPSSLDMNRRGSAVRSGRADLAHKRLEQGSMSRSITGGDVDTDVENAYFSGDEAPGGDNPTPDQDIVEDIGKALGVTYQDAEELKGSDKIVERDKHRWEMDPASAEDYKDRK